MKMDFRTAELWNGSNWEPIEFFDIKPSQLIRLKESTGEAVIGLNGETSFLTTTEAKINENGIWYFEC